MLAEEQRREPRRVMKKIWGLQGDGDLWQQFWQLVRARGANTVKVTKVKGHATEQQVEEGKVRTEDKEGNDNADQAADQGVNQHARGLRGMVEWIQQRQKKYIEVMSEIQAMIIEVLKEQEEKAKEEKKTR